MGAETAASAERVDMAFLFTDIVGSTALWERFPDSMPEALRVHDALLETCVDVAGGQVIHRAGDGMIASFPTTGAAATAAIDAQRRMLATDWSAVGDLGVRMALHRGQVVMRDGAPYGWALNFGSRFCDVGSAGQILVSESALATLGASVPDGASVSEVATVTLRDIAEPAVVHQLLAPGLLDRFPDLRDTLAPRPLPTPPNDLVGRTADLSLLEQLARTNRLISVVGPPGVGTSRLGSEFVNRILPRFPDGVVAVDVADVWSTAADAIAHAAGLGTVDEATPVLAVARGLQGRRLVLFVDRVNGPTDELVDVIQAVLLSANSVTVVCAGRSPLALHGEVVHHVEPLDESDAIELLERRTPDADHGVSVEPAMREIARLTDGLPLSLEVAAGATDVYTWDEIATMLRSGRAGGSNSAVIAPVAVGLTDLPEDLYARLVAATSFAGSFDRLAFHAVCSPGFDTARSAEQLNQLVDRSLIVRESSADRTTFRLLRPIREVVEAEADPEDRASAERRLEQWAREFVAQAAQGLRGRDERLWNRRLEAQMPNLRAVFSRALARADVVTAASLAIELWDYGFMRFSPECLGWSDQLVVAAPDAPPEILGPLHGVAALGAWIGDDLPGVARHAARALELEEAHGLAFDLPARLALISASVYSGAERPPEHVYAESADYQRGRPELYFHVNVETQNSVMSRWLGDVDGAVDRALGAVRLARESGNSSSLAFGLWALGGALADDDPIFAETHLANALELARDVGNRWLIALSQMSLVSIRHRTSGAVAATPILIDLLDMLVSGGHRTHLWSSLRLASAVLADLGDEELAVQLAAWVSTVDLAMPPFPSDVAILDGVAGRIESSRGEAWVRRRQQMSSSWTPETATALAREALERHLDAR